MHQKTRGFDVFGHIGQHPLHALELGDLLFELLPLLSVVQGGFQPCLTDTNRERCNADAPFVEHTHHHMETTAFIAQKSVGRESHVGKAQRTYLARALAHLVLFGAALDTVRVKIDDEDRHSAMPGLFVRPDQHKSHIRNWRIVDPNLTPIQHPTIAVPHRLGPDPGDIGPSFRFGDAVSNLGFGRHHIRQILGALRVGSVMHQQGRNQLDQPALIRNRRISARELLHHQRVCQRVESRPAHIFGHANSKKAQPPHFLVKRHRKTFIPVEFFGNRTDGAFSKIAHHIAHLNMRMGEVHHRFRW